MYTIQTRTNAIVTQRSVEAADNPLQPGEIRVAVETLALTANTVTYAVAGFDVGYWKFFPTDAEGWGIVPAWGFARVVKSRCEGIAEGQRFYGFWPMASTCVLRPEARGDGFVDRADHRVDLPAVYNRYLRAADSASAAEPYQALLQPLAATSWLIADWLDDHAGFGADQIVVGSASSKTGLALCRFLVESRFRVVGLTSAGNLDFVADHGLCDQVLSYEDIEKADKISSVYVDMAGNAGVKQRVHAHFDSLLQHSAAVGLSHWDQFSPKLDLAGPKPEFFFAPAQIAKRQKDWGAGVVQGRISQAVGALAQDAAAWTELQHHSGPQAGMDAFGALAAGKTRPQEGHIWDL